MGALVLVTSLSVASMALANDRQENSDSMKHDEGMKNKDEAHAAGSTLEVHFLDNGKVLVRGAKVTDVSTSANIVHAVTSWGSVTLNWAVAVDNNTEMIRRFGGKSLLSEISVGDFLSFQGGLETTVAAPYTVHATVLKDWSIQKRSIAVKTTIEGTIKSISGTGVPTTLVLTAGNKDYTIKIDANTSLLNTLWLRATLDSGFHVGDKVRVYGAVNTDMTVDATVVRDTSSR